MALPVNRHIARPTKELAHISGEAIFLRYGPNREEAEPGYELCERAIAADPRNARALSILAEKFATGSQLRRAPIVTLTFNVPRN